MNWWGKIIGGTLGYMLGGPIGALLGAVLGHNLDKGINSFSYNKVGHPDQQQRTQAAFFTAVFSVMGHICKADGIVTPDEINTAKMIMSRMVLTKEQKKAAIELFNAGKQPDFPIEAVLIQLKKEIGLSRNIKRVFLEIQCYAALADGVMHPDEQRLLIKICSLLGFPQYEFESIAASIAAELHHEDRGKTTKSTQMTLKEAYAILDISASTKDKEVKRAYRRLISQHHPDKLVSKGLPEEMIKIANQRTQEIREAYERIMQDRKNR